ncbi:amino acid/amide ABC transporter membrane protein 2, HAAT family [Halovenus aranensis]|uniref:Amino acid/amide ABC transporter membrane protein 2, HAAT family n=1 Tax=Halovenus aranensis TaxID=890420 RepID=A0A1G8X2B4_9EURY|nr:branched-chain amino acid ABC transporter permease [Halovenus aranensis]SDJ84673.1 amino acid/amide ABC transporter membrane protein 2, HAAT family [Halovenus aranensis]
MTASEATQPGLRDRFIGWIEQSDRRIVLATVAFVYGVFAILVILEQGLGLGTVNSIFGAWRTITFLFAAYALLTLALNLHWGYTGMFNIGVAGFMAVGVYTMGLLSTSPDALSGQGLGLPLPIGILGGMIAAALVGLVAAIPALRVSADYLAIVTLGLSEIIRLSAGSRTLSNWTTNTFGAGTGGGSGMDLPDRPTDFIFNSSIGESIADVFTVDVPRIDMLLFEFGNREVTLISSSILSDFVWTFVMLLVLAGVYWMVRRIGYSPFGRVLKAIREDELVAQSLGKDTRRFKIKVFMLGCALMGLAGILWQGSQGFANPNSYRPVVTFYAFIALIIGGSGSNTGSVVGSILFVGLLFEGPRQVGAIISARLNLADAPGTFDGAVAPLAQLDVTPFLAYAVDNIAPLQFVLLGVVLIIIIQKRPDGVLGDRTETAAAIDLHKEETNE